jgi:hypothetical protein
MASSPKFLNKKIQEKFRSTQMKYSQARRYEEKGTKEPRVLGYSVLGRAEVV